MSPVRIKQSSNPSNCIPLRLPSLVVAAWAKAVLCREPRGTFMVEPLRHRFCKGKGQEEGHRRWQASIHERAR
jgi:hypothetical protein